MKKIAIMGVHSAGKTTLAYILSAYFKMKDYNVKLIHESVRENCPFPINENANQGTCLWNFHRQFLNELEAESQGYQLAICDRSVMDTFVYFHAVNPSNHITKSAVEQAAQWLTTYDLLICLEPEDGIALHEDGIRATDRGYLNLVRDGFRKKLKKYANNVEDRLLVRTSRDVFHEELRSELLQEVEQRLHVKERTV